MFAHGVTYAEFLNERNSPKSENEKTAHLKELADCGTTSPRTQGEMRRLLQTEEARSAQNATQQMNFGPYEGAPPLRTHHGTNRCPRGTVSFPLGTTR